MKMSLKFDFEGKVALITGSSSGIGASTALLFSKSGANVVVTGRNADKVSVVAKQCREVSNNKTKVLEVVADVTKEEDLKLLINETIKTFGKLDILVNNAGEGTVITVADPDYIKKFKRTLDINLNSVVLLTHLSVEHLEKTKGNIINISSIVALRSGKAVTPYNVAKAGLDMFTKCMAAELGSKGIRVNVINPGVIKTNFLNAMGMGNATGEAIQNIIREKLPVGRLGEGDDIANAILFLASDVSSFTTGSNFVSDGGHIAANVL